MIKFPMARFKENSKKQGLFVEVDLSAQILPDTLEHTIDFMVDEKIDLSCLESEYHNDDAGACAYNPKDLIKIIILSFSRGFKSARDMERLCRENITFMALSGDIRPDHATIARFIQKFEEHLKEIFNQILLYMDLLGLIGGEEMAIDGCKISSNSAKDNSGTFEELDKKKEKFEKIIETILKQSKEINEDQAEIDADIDSRINKYRKKIEKIDSFLKNNKKRIGSRNKEVKSNLTDNESAKMKSSHGVIQGYSALAAVDSKHQAIVSAMAVGTSGEATYLKEVVEDAKQNLPGKITKETTVLADTGFFCEENCEYLINSDQKAVIPDIHFRQRDERFGREKTGKDKNHRNPDRKRLFEHHDFDYLPEKNCYQCPAGKCLQPDGHVWMKGNYGQRFRNKQNDCHFCYLRTKCLKKKTKNKSLFIIEIRKPKTFSEKMIDIIDSTEGRKEYSKRMGIVEPVFANITYAKKLNRFNVRGKAQVNIVWMFYCIVHNIEKIYRYGGLCKT